MYLINSLIYEVYYTCHWPNRCWLLPLVKALICLVNMGTSIPKNNVSLNTQMSSTADVPFSN